MFTWPVVVLKKIKLSVFLDFDLESCQRTYTISTLWSPNGEVPCPICFGPAALEKMKMGKVYIQASLK